MVRGGRRTRALMLVGAAGAVGALVSCRTPTDVTVAISTDIPCGDVGSTTITVGASHDLETSPPTTSTTTCGEDGFVGTLVIVPSDTDDDTVAFKVVSGYQKRAEDCTPPDYKGCIVERRALHYLPHKELRVNVAMERDCLDVPCTENETCHNARCVSAQVDPSQCEGSGCGADALGADDGGVPDATTADAGSGQDVVVADTSTSDTSLGDDTSLGEDTGVDAGCSAGDTSCDGLVPRTCVAGAWVASAPACNIACSVGRCVSVRGIAVGAKHTCAVLSDGAVRCWGDNSTSQLGAVAAASTTTFSSRPLDNGQRAFILVAGGNTTCNLDADGHVDCWGANESGQLGVPPATTTASAARVRVPGVTTAFNDGGLDSIPLPVAVGGRHACAVNADAGVICWGRDVEGQVGAGTFATTLAPTPVGVASTTVGAGGLHSCDVASGGFDCWGFDSQAQLGTGPAVDAGFATPQLARQSGTYAVWAGGEHTCGLNGNQFPRCWGRNSEGQCGVGNTNGPVTSPTSVTGNILYAYWFALGSRHTCALQHGLNGAKAGVHEGELDCWGDNTHGQLGLGNTITPQPNFQVVSLPAPIVALGAGGDHTCVVLNDGRAACWGENDRGQIGDGTVGVDRPSPTFVQF